MKRAGFTTALALLLIVPASLVSAQDPDPGDPTSGQIRFEVEFDKAFSIELNPANPSVQIGIKIRDQSFVVANSGTSAGSSQQIKYSFEANPLVDDPTWQLNALPPSIAIQPGSTGEAALQVVGPMANQQAEYYNFTLNVTAEPQVCCGGSKSQQFEFVVHLPGPQVIGGRAVGGVSTQTVRPNDVAEFDLEFTNLGLADKTINMRVSSNNCGLDVTTTSFHLTGRETKVVPVSVLAPADKAYYSSENCVVVVVAESADGQGSKSIPLTVQVQGVYVDPGWIINLVIVLAVIALIIWLILLAKRRAEEEVLGKPQPPWTLPAEQVYLAELQKKDPQAAYVVRHFLMEDEYASSLMWYHSFKKATKGRRKAERKALKIEHAFEKWDLRMQAQLANTADTDKPVAKLQAKLDRKTKKAHQKEHTKWKKQVSKLETKAANDHNKAMNEYRKAAKKAAKKGEPAPKQPVMAQPDLPPEPQMESMDVDDHPKFSKKKQRVLDRASKNEERAEANYERLRAKKLEVTQRKLAKLAKDIDDPAFVNEHPMLKDAVAASA